MQKALILHLRFDSTTSARTSSSLNSAMMQTRAAKGGFQENSAPRATRSLLTLKSLPLTWPHPSSRFGMLDPLDLVDKSCCYAVLNLGHVTSLQLTWLSWEIYADLCWAECMSRLLTTPSKNTAMTVRTSTGAHKIFVNQSKVHGIRIRAWVPLSQEAAFQSLPTRDLQPALGTFLQSGRKSSC